MESQLIDDFGGVYKNIDKNLVPPNHWIDALNIQFIDSSIQSRRGFILEFPIADILRVKRYEIPGEDDHVLVLTTGGTLYDATVSVVTPILTIVGMTDFAAVSLYGRAYISPNDGIEGLQDTPLYVYDPSVAATARIAAGDPPSDFELTVATLTPTVALADVVAPVAPANGALTLTTSPYIPPTPSTLKFTQTGGAVTGFTLVIVGKDAAGEAQTETYVNKVKSAGPTTFTTFEIWSEITSATISALAGAGGLFKIEVTGKPPGKIEKGYHIIAIAYETKSGFITSPGPATATGTNFAVFLTTKAGRALTVSGIPASPPAGTTKIHILSSKAIVKSRYSGDPNQYELFFIPDTSGGIIPVGQTSATINFFDADLVDSADFLKDNMSQVPAGVALLSTSTGRLLICGLNSTSVVGDADNDELSNNTVIFASKGGEPESFSKTDGFVIIKPGGEGLKNLAEYRTLIYAYKSNRTYVTQDNGDLPSTWEVDGIDNSIGAEPHSVSVSLGSDSAQQDLLFVASRSGLYLFTGTYGDLPLSWKIKEVWDGLATGNFRFVELAVDPQNKVMLILLPGNPDIDGPTLIYMMDYSRGLNWDTVRWCPWEVYKPTQGEPCGGDEEPECDPTPIAIAPTSIFSSIESNLEADATRFHLGSSDDNVYFFSLTHTRYNDSQDDTGIDAFFRTYPGSFSQVGGVTQVTGFRLEVQGPCTLLVALIGPEDTVVESFPSIDIPSPARANILEKINFVEDEASISLIKDNALDSRFIISKMWIYGQEIWTERPA